MKDTQRAGMCGTQRDGTLYKPETPHQAVPWSWTLSLENSEEQISGICSHPHFVISFFLIFISF